MRVHLLRNATMRLSYAGISWLTDPYLAPRFSRPSFTGASPNPLVDLPCSPEQVVAGIDATIVSHRHSDHFDPLARRLLPKALPLFCQPWDREEIRGEGFVDVRPVEGSVRWRGVTITRIPARHGSGAVLDEMGRASGFVLQAAGEPTLYWIGDSVWCEEAARTIARFDPQVILTHSSGAVWGGGVLIVMDAAQTLEACRAAPHSTVIAVHLEALDHGTVSRAQLRAAAEAGGIPPRQLRIPRDGEEIEVGARPGRPPSEAGRRASIDKA
jgi:L-ascorbate metabolism protein UlaG (beta-lactamase superfamily)